MKQETNVNMPTMISQKRSLGFIFPSFKSDLILIHAHWTILCTLPSFELSFYHPSLWF
jgi:hypothetical protein